MTAPLHTDEAIRETAIANGVCVRPILQRATDTATGEVRMVAMPCGSTKARVCPPCAERARRLRMHQCREGWHLTEEPVRQSDEDAEDEDDLVDEEQAGRRVRSTRHRQDVARLPRPPMSERTIGETFTDRKTGKTYRPSMFLTLTLDSYGPVRDDGTPVSPATYDYRRAALDALHFPKLVDRFFQNLRRCAGYEVQYFATVEEQRRLAPHLHAALRGAIPRQLLREVAAATYHQVWWPPHKTPVDATELPAWCESHSAYVDAGGGRLPTWDEALDLLGADPTARPAHVVRFGTQVKPKGIIPGPEGERTIGYLCKYLVKDLGATYAEDDEGLTPRQAAHLDRLHREIRWLPCSPDCANWLAYGVQPRNARPDMQPGRCSKRAHDRANAGLGGRRVLVSRRWTGKTLARHRADRASVVRAVLEDAGVDPDDHRELSADRIGPDGQARWRWEPVSLRDRTELAYVAAIRHAVKTRNRWRADYEHAKTVAAARAGPGRSQVGDCSAIRQLVKEGS